MVSNKRSWWATLCAGLVAVVGLIGCTPQYPSCTGDNACASRREVCVNSRCQQCRADTDCSGGQRCVGNRCEAPPVVAECTEERACATGQMCVSGRCVAETPGSVTARPDGPGACVFPVIHFGFDDATIPASDQPPLRQTGDCLAAERTTRYVLIGRADPRGTSEYNLALGERRARAVQRFMMGVGIAETRLAVSSEGSEGAHGSDEAGWARDRRVDPNQR
ncbi:MAG: OmpA family protein [Deltaproteobacteria bacterium]|nr:OmpA family protein [Deltaproteobacteria bacterium]